MLPEAAGFALTLDGKRARTPGGRALVVDGSLLAEAVAAEWNNQREFIDPSSMPVTRLANSAIDGVAHRPEDVREAILAYAASDLLCYRAGEPQGLVARQRELWDPILAWAERRFHVRFVLAEGVVHVAQPPATAAAIAEELAEVANPFRLAGLSLATTLTSSALIALALAAGALGIDAAWAAAHVDEDWNISQWGEDSEAAERRARRYADFRAAALALGR
jgi:chaperone required for assembly of F1-ATPase